MTAATLLIGTLAKQQTRTGWSRRVRGEADRRPGGTQRPPGKTRQWIPSRLVPTAGTLGHLYFVFV